MQSLLTSQRATAFLAPVLPPRLRLRSYGTTLLCQNTVSDVTVNVHRASLTPSSSSQHRCETNATLNTSSSSSSFLLSAVTVATTTAKISLPPSPLSSSSPPPPLSTTSPTTTTTNIIPTATATATASTTTASSSPSLLTLLSTIVGICVLIGSVLYKLPQVIRVVRRRSADGISITMYALETLGTTFSALYFLRRAFPFSTYGETVFIMIQNVILLALIVIYNHLPKIPAILLSLIYVIMITLLLSSSFTPLSTLVFLQFCSIPILNLARLPQIFLNYKRKDTGELSPITLGLQLLGNIARIFTTIAQVKDTLMFVSICVSTCFNATLFVQWIYYSRRRRRVQQNLDLTAANSSTKTPLTSTPPTS